MSAPAQRASRSGCWSFTMLCMDDYCESWEKFFLTCTSKRNLIKSSFVIASFLFILLVLMKNGTKTYEFEMLTF